MAKRWMPFAIAAVCGAISYTYAGTHGLSYWDWLLVMSPAFVAGAVR